MYVWDIYIHKLITFNKCNKEFTNLSLIESPTINFLIEIIRKIDLIRLCNRNDIVNNSERNCDQCSHARIYNSKPIGRAQSTGNTYIPQSPASKKRASVRRWTRRAISLCHRSLRNRSRVTISIRIVKYRDLSRVRHPVTATNGLSGSTNDHLPRRRRAR